MAADKRDRQAVELFHTDTRQVRHRTPHQLHTLVEGEQRVFVWVDADPDDDAAKNLGSPLDDVEMAESNRIK